MEVLFRTIHGSHLYGLAHAESDLDYYEVVAKEGKGRRKYATHSIKDGIDITRVDFNTFRRHCDEGVPQALEACFSQMSEVDLLTDFRASYRIDTAKTVARYKRTIKSFSVGNAKQRRHAVRLMFNLDMMLFDGGRFNPTFNEEGVKWLNAVASLPDELYFRHVDNYLTRED